MQFEPFDWPSLVLPYGPLEGIMFRLSASGKTKFPQLRADAVACGMDLQSGRAWGTLAVKHVDNTWFCICVIADENTVWPSESPITVVDYFERGEVVAMRPWHIIAQAIGTPIEIHQKWQPGLQEMQTAFLYLENLKKKSELDIAWKVLKLLQKDIQAPGGRPPGTTIRTLEEKKKAVDEVRKYKRKYGTTYRVAAARVYKMEGQEENAYKQFQRDRGDAYDS